MRFSKLRIAEVMSFISSDVSVKSQVIGSIIISITETTTTTTTTTTSEKPVEIEQCEMPPPYFYHPGDQPDLPEVYINITICKIVKNPSSH